MIVGWVTHYFASVQFNDDIGRKRKEDYCLASVARRVVKDMGERFLYQVSYSFPPCLGA